MSADMIQPVPVERDSTGCWWHPAIPDIGENDGDAWNAWLSGQSLEVRHSRLEDELDSHPAYIAYYDNGDCGFGAWMPECPDGEGWFVLAVADTEDGPSCCWARHIEAPAADLPDAEEGSCD